MDSKKPGEETIEGDGALAAAISKINLIESILGGDDDIPSEVTFHMSLGEVLALFPKQYVRETPSGGDRQNKVAITMDDLFAQLSKGKATMSVAKLAFFVPSHLLQQEAFADTTTMITLPLPTIIKAVGVDKLKNHMAKKVRRYKIDDIDDPFRNIFDRKGKEAAPAAPPQAAVATSSSE